MIEGVESAENEWPLLAVQWHPEELTGTDDGWDHALFTTFAKMVRDAAAQPTRPVRSRPGNR